MQWLFLTWLYICEAWENMCNELNRAEGFYHKARNTSFPLHLESFKVQQDFRSRIMSIVSGPWKAKITSLRKSQTFSCHTRSIVAAKPCWWVFLSEVDPRMIIPCCNFLRNAPWRLTLKITKLSSAKIFVSNYTCDFSPSALKKKHTFHTFEEIAKLPKQVDPNSVTAHAQLHIV